MSPNNSQGRTTQTDLDGTVGYRIECKECGGVAFGDPETDIKWDKRYHRMHHCPDAEFEVEDDG